MAKSPRGLSLWTYPLGIFEHRESGFVPTKMDFVAKGIKCVVSPKIQAFVASLSGGSFVRLIEFRRVGLLRPNACSAGARYRSADQDRKSRRLEPAIPSHCAPMLDGTPRHFFAIKSRAA